MSKAKIDEARENRIIMEVVVDAYDEERAMGWYYYLDDSLMDRAFDSDKPDSDELLTAFLLEASPRFRATLAEGVYYGSWPC